MLLIVILMTAFFPLRVLMGVVENISAAEGSQLVNTTGVDLVVSDLLSKQNGGMLESPKLFHNILDTF